MASWDTGYWATGILGYCILDTGILVYWYTGILGYWLLGCWDTGIHNTDYWILDTGILGYWVLVTGIV